VSDPLPVASLRAVPLCKGDNDEPPQGRLYLVSVPLTKGDSRGAKRPAGGRSQTVLTWGSLCRLTGKDETGSCLLCSGFFLIAIPILSQSPPAGRAQFDVASVKVHPPPLTRIIVQTPPGRFLAEGFSLKMLVGRGFWCAGCSCCRRSVMGRFRAIRYRRQNHGGYDSAGSAQPDDSKPPRGSVSTEGAQRNARAADV
jgi:hypothetical protein